MDTVANFSDPIFTEFPERLNLYFKSPITVLNVRSMLSDGYEIKLCHQGTDLDIFDWVRVYVSKPSVSTYAKYFYTYEYGNLACENGLVKFLKSIEEIM